MSNISLSTSSRTLLDDKLVLFVEATGQTHLLDSSVEQIFKLLENNSYSERSLLKALEGDFPLHEQDLLSQYIKDVIHSLVEIEAIKVA